MTTTELQDLSLAWLDHSRSQGLSPATISRRVASVRQFGKYLGIDLLADYKSPPQRKAQPRPLPGGIDDIQLMADAAVDSSEEAMIWLCGTAGLRISEARSVTPGHLTTEGDQTWVQVIGKGYKAREVAVPARSAGRLLALARLRHPDEPLVLLTDSQARKAWKRAAARVGLRDSATHDGRATVATAILGSTGNLRLAQEVLGHASVATTQGYTGVSRRQLAAAMGDL